MKNVSIEIKALQNGFLIEKSWYQPAVDPKDYGYHKNERWTFATWAEVSAWVSDNALDMPPVI